MAVPFSGEPRRQIPTGPYRPYVYGAWRDPHRTRSYKRSMETEAHYALSREEYTHPEYTPKEEEIGAMLRYVRMRLHGMTGNQLAKTYLPQWDGALVTNVESQSTLKDIEHHRRVYTTAVMVEESIPIPDLEWPSLEVLQVATTVWSKVGGLIFPEETLEWKTFQKRVEEVQTQLRRWGIR